LVERGELGRGGKKLLIGAWRVLTVAAVHDRR